MVRGRLIARWTLAAVALTTGIVAGRHSLALGIGDRQPVEALRLDGAQPAALALKAYLALADKPRPIEMVAAERTALRALALDPTEVNAVVDIALVREMQRRPADATELMRYAERLSRRNLVTQFWWVEYWSAKDNVPRTLHHYDVALRTSAAAPGVLYPILVSAVSDMELADALAQVLARRPLWSEQFLQQLAQSGTSTDGIARVFDDLARLRAPVPDRTLATAIDRLLAAQKTGTAWALYTRYRPTVARAPLRDPDFSAVGPEPTAFDWRLLQDGVSTNAQDGAVRIDATPGAGGTALRQVVRLAPGAHRLRIRFDPASDIGADAGARPVLSVKCLQAGAALGNSQNTTGNAPTIDVIVPRGCAAQVIEVALQSGDTAGGASTMIREVTLLH